jgi:hypothetical protein
MLVTYDDACGDEIVKEIAVGQSTCGHPERWSCKGRHMKILGRVHERQR